MTLYKYPVGATSGEKWELVEEKVFAGGAQTYDITGLDGDADGGYMFEAATINDGGGYSDCTLRLNGATAIGHWQTVRYRNAVVTAASGSTLNILLSSSTSISVFFLTIPASRTGDARGGFIFCHDGGTTIQNWLKSFEFTTPASGTNITSIGLTSNIANGLGVGTVMRVWKRAT